jgi:acetoin utilization protein AcuB
MTSDPITVSPKTRYSEAFRLLHLKKLQALPVVDQEGQLVGIVTERDLLDISPIAVLGAHTISDVLSAMAVEEAMTRQVVTVPEDYPLEEAACILIDNRIGSLPVMREHELVGLITEADIFRAMIGALGGRSEGLRIAIRLSEDKGELGAITDGIVRLGGRLISLTTFWSGDIGNRMVTLKVQGADAEELVLFLEETVGVEVIDFCESRAEDQPKVSSSQPYAGMFPIQNLDATATWFLDPK